MLKSGPIDRPNTMPLSGMSKRCINVKLSSSTLAQHSPSTIMAPGGIEFLALESLMREEFFKADGESFVYRPLHGVKFIRVLRLYPGVGSSTLCGSLAHAAIGNEKYSALSYAWGNPSKPCFIELDGYRMPLTQSLYNALLRLRLSFRERILWADGICINQEDEQEKASQVMLMSEIYSSATKVLVHLGNTADASDLIPELVSKIQKTDFRSLPNTLWLSTDSLGVNHLPPSTDPVWEALQNFYCRAWFHRVWYVRAVTFTRISLNLT